LQAFSVLCYWNWRRERDLNYCCM